METIAAFGDSVLKGVIYENEHYRVSDASFQKICEEYFGITIENKAKFGSTISKGEQVFERNLNLIRDFDGKYVVLEFGGNDCDFNWKEIAADPEKVHLPMSTIANFTATYTDIIREIKKQGKIPVLLSLPPIDSKRYFQHISRGLSGENIMKWMRNDGQYITNWHERYNIEIFKLAIANEIPVIDITSTFLERKNYSQYLCNDGIHPNEEGHKLIAEAIKRHVDDRNIEFQQILLQHDYGYIAVDNEKAIGFAYGYVLNEPDGRKTYYLHAIDIMAGYQNLGYGTELVRFVYAHSKSLGCRKMFLMTNIGNASACRCYEKAGGTSVADDVVMYEYKK